MNESLKVQAHHLERHAYLYVRQSSMRQVVENVERVGKTVRPGTAGRRGMEDCDDFMKLRLSSSGWEARPAKGEPARAGSEPGDGRGNETGEA